MCTAKGDDDVDNNMLNSPSAPKTPPDLYYVSSSTAIPWHTEVHEASPRRYQEYELDMPRDFGCDKAHRGRPSEGKIQLS